MNEAKLIQKARKGDSDSIADLYSMHKDSIYKFIYYKVGSQDDAEDIFQDVMIAAFNGLEKFREEVPFLHWCYNIARNQIAFFWRKHYQQSTVELDENTGENIAAEDSEDFISDEILNQEEDKNKKAIAELLQTLEPPRYSEVLRLRFLESKSLPEIASLLEITLGNAKVLQNRALKKASKLMPLL